ncbi:MAG: hypothetical protein ACFFF9_02685 [Candidatus Thorarchaeota archaeon]
MSRLEEKSEKRLIVVDSSQARNNHLRMFSFSLLLAVVYAVFLLLVCSTRPDVTSSLLLFGSQIAIGFPATRAYYAWGVSNKEKLTFLDPSKLNGKGVFREVDIHMGDIPLFFENMSLKVNRYDKRYFDDLNDIAWFGIFVWAAFSSSMFFLEINGSPLCVAGSLVLMLSCTGVYLNGYRKTRAQSFEDDLNHLQYYVGTRYKHLDHYLHKTKSRVFLQMSERRRSIALLEFSLEVPLGGVNLLEFHMGLSSSENERFVIKADDDTLNRIIDKMQQMKELEDGSWMAERIITSSGPIVRIVHQSSKFSIINRASYVRSPNLVDESSSDVGNILGKVLEVAVVIA